MPDQTPNVSAGDPNVVAAMPFPGQHVRPARERLLEAVLVVSGEIGYDEVAVKDVIERARTSRGTFYKHFSSKEDCFVQAYAGASEWLYRRLLGLAKRQPSWREGLRTGLAELLEFCANQPAMAKALLIEAHTAGGQALAQHDELMERLSRAVDSARRETESRHSPPPTTSLFMVGAIETLVRAKLMSGDAARAPEMLPGLLHYVMMQYFGEEIAWEEMASAPVATWESRRRAASEMP
jgi:AcrR family transcriptional regulator